MELSAAVCRWLSEDVRLEVATRSDVVATPHPATIADKALDTDGRRFSFNTSDSWRQVLKNVFQAPAGVQGFLVQGFADACVASLPAMPAQDWA